MPPHIESMDGCKLDHRQSLPRSAHESNSEGASVRDPATSSGRERTSPYPTRLHDKAKIFADGSSVKDNR